MKKTRQIQKDDTVVIIGSGFGSLALACLLGERGITVHIYERHDRPGGRARVLKEHGFRFDMGPSWYLMPDVFEHFFSLLGEKVEDRYALQKLTPSYKIFFENQPQSTCTLSTDLAETQRLLESFEPGSGDKLKRYLEQCSFQYHTALEKFLHKNYDSFFDFFTWDIMTRGLRMGMFSKMQDFVSKFFQDDRIQKIMQYTLVFLGASPYNAPALYALMSHVDLIQGVYYPEKGFATVVDAFYRKADQYPHVHFHFNTDVQHILVNESTHQAYGIIANGTEVSADIVISGSDRHFTDTVLLPRSVQEYSDATWKKATLAPSAFLLYLGVRGSLPHLEHHTLVFSNNWKENFQDIFDTKKFPLRPSLYLCAPSITDPDTAPAGHEALFVLVPTPAGIGDVTGEERQRYRDHIIDWIEQETGEMLRDRIVYEKIYSADEFTQDYSSFGGSALGLAHTLEQTALFRPSNVHKKIHNLYYVGSNTVPGIGVPMCIISAQLVYKRLYGIHHARPLTREEIASS